MSSIDIKQMMIPDFWKMISDVNWKKTNTSSSAVNNKIMVGYPPYKANYFKNIAYDFASKLADLYITKIKKTNMYTALVASYEAVARGRSVYEEFLNNPSNLSEILENTNVNNEDELFYFALPSEDDYFKDKVNEVKEAVLSYDDYQDE